MRITAQGTGPAYSRGPLLPHGGDTRRRLRLCREPDTAGTARVRRTGAFRDNGDFSTDGTFNLVHTDEADSQADEVIVNLYERMSARSADRLLASVTEVDGDRISLPAGRTLNLLIELNEGGGLSIRMEITPWNEIYQWDIW